MQHSLAASQHFFVVRCTVPCCYVVLSIISRQTSAWISYPMISLNTSGPHSCAESRCLGMQTFAMDESRDEDPNCTHSATSIHEEQTLERSGSMPERTASMREHVRQSSAARKVQNIITLVFPTEAPAKCLLKQPHNLEARKQASSKDHSTMVMELWH